jgi:hypothetical protein
MAETSLLDLSTDQNARVPERQHPLYVKDRLFESLNNGMYPEPCSSLLRVCIALEECQPRPFSDHIL